MSHRGQDNMRIQCQATLLLFFFLNLSGIDSFSLNNPNNNGGLALRLNGGAQTKRQCLHSQQQRLARQSAASSSSPTALDAVVVVAGATGYIGRNVVRESVARRDQATIALVRDVEQARNSPYLQGAELLECDVGNPAQVKSTFAEISNRYGRIDDVVSCLASRSGVKADAYAIDYQAAKNVMKASEDEGAGHFCLLSAYCVRKPLLQFQHAKLKLEAELQKSSLAYSIVRPTAFFKSVAGQFENLKAGKQIVLFGDGESAPCNPIAESDLAEYMLDCRLLPNERQNRILDIGGSGQPVTHKLYNTMMCEALGMEPRYFYVPTAVFDVAIGVCSGLHKILRLHSLEDAAEIARIIRYYAVEPMLTENESEKYGKKELADYYQDIAANGQEYDPFVSFYSKPRSQTTVQTLETVYNTTGS